jgi:hypothetical protein
MDQRGDEVHTSATEATGASKEGVVRWVLVIGLLLAIAFLTIIWITGAFSQNEDDVHENVGREIQQQADSANDQGEPMMPAIDDGATASPSAQTTPGDAPAGDPRPDAQ